MKNNNDEFLNDEFLIEEVETSMGALMQGCKCPEDLSANIKRRVTETNN